MADKNEIRFDATAKDVAVLDGYCVGVGKTRTVVMGEILKSWAEAKLHESMMVCRVSGCNPSDAGGSGGT